MNKPSEFYVGYLPMPAGLKRWTRVVTAGLGALALAAGCVLVAGQHPFPASTFEFQQYREFRGTLVSKPYLTLSTGDGKPWLLAGPGKHGADVFFAGGVSLRGERIFRDGGRMIELLPGSLHPAVAPAPPATAMDFGPIQLTGEIVDSKCYFGVMNPGNGKVHRDCAVRCISGGIPPSFLVRDAAGRAMALLLANWKHEWLDHVAEPVTLRGRMVRSRGQLILYAE